MFPSKANAIAEDKQAHFMVCTFISGATYAGFRQAKKSKRDAWAAAVFTGLAVGIAKEAFDATMPNNYFDFQDLVADAAGSITGPFLVWTFE